MVSLPINLDSLRFSSSFSSLKRPRIAKEVRERLQMSRWLLPRGNLWRAHVFPYGALQQSYHPAAHEGSRDPAPHSGGVLVFGKSCAVGFSAVVLKLMETLKVTEAPLPGSVCAPVQRSPLAEFPRASAELPRASEESSARLRGAWRCCPPLVAGQPRVGLRADPRSGAWRRLLP
jgi:hypothetical protein